MTDYFDLNGIIIKVQPVGEYDKRVTLLTKERGKVSAFARGARRQGSSLMGVTRIFACGRFRMREGRDSYNLISASVDNYFEDLFKDVESSCYGTYFLELADYYSRESMSEPQMIKLLYYALTALTKPSLPHRLTRRVFELRIMKIDGQYDQEPPLSTAGETTAFTWKFILETPIERLFTFVLRDEILTELEECADRSLKKYVDRKMNSLDILESIG
ncbi:MAG: DNA repair protein RecO [Lachnospiraceae bacterium]|nr:DNA repair protein RecO [Candidatus Darwinimomas equi]